MKNLLTILVTLCTAIAGSARAEEQRPKVLILRVIEHPALDSTSQGAKDLLIQNGIDKKRIILQSAQGQPTMAKQIIMSELSQNPRLVVIAVGTMPAQTCKTLLRKYPNLSIVYASVTDPVSSDILPSGSATENITGVSNFTPLQPQIEFFQRIQPNLKTLGMLYNPGEKNSTIMVQKVQEACEKSGVSLEVQAVLSAEMMVTGVQNLVNKNVNALFVSNDNLALSLIPLISKTARRSCIPLYVSDTDVVMQGALAAFGPDQYAIGQQAGKMALTLLSKGPLVIPIEGPAQSTPLINAKLAKQFKITIPASLQSSEKS
ncbi:MAG: ABC transporter substrate-binding protein [Alphaproteobacteria bacterium]|nr:ABC transporter substrate-binding protein [Alphaproteobacteria bacterium]